MSRDLSEHFDHARMKFHFRIKRSPVISRTCVAEHLEKRLRQRKIGLKLKAINHRLHMGIYQEMN